MIWYGSDLDTTNGDNTMNPLKALGLLKSAQKLYAALVKDGSIAKLTPLIPQIKSALDVLQVEWTTPAVQSFLKDVKDSGIIAELQSAVNTPDKAKFAISAFEEAMASDLNEPTVKVSMPATDGHPHQSHDVPPAAAKLCAAIEQLKHK